MSVFAVAIPNIRMRRTDLFKIINSGKLQHLKEKCVKILVDKQQRTDDNKY